MKKIVFLILHYHALEETLKCIDSIDKLTYKNKEVVIVDNCSMNGTGKILKDKYNNSKNIHVILSEENLGFARGNNLGFVFAKKKLKADFIVMCNNDVYMIQDNFCELVIDEFRKSNFSILGPRILLNNNTVCAYNDKLLSLKKLKKYRIWTKFYYYLNKVHLRFIYSIINKIKIKFTKSLIIDTSIRKENVVINGCCIIFSKNYIEKFDGIDNRTFLYHEEPLLYIRIMKNELKSVYNPYIMVFHDEGVATSQSLKNKTKKIDYKLKCELNSLDILISEMEDFE